MSTTAPLEGMPTMEDLLDKASQALAKHLKTSVESLDIHKRLTSYGLDSIDTFTVLGQIEDWLGLELPSTLLWDFSTISEVAHYIIENYEELKAQSA
jgi:acyl carrier protein